MIQKVHIQLLDFRERLQSKVLHPYDPLTEVVDDWGVSMKWKKCLVERMWKKKKIKLLFSSYKIMKYGI